MPYRLETGEKLSSGVRRLLIERINQIVLDLADHPEGRDKGVHDARKNCKRIRATYRLIRDEIGLEIYRQENIRFRNTARLFAGVRDSWVMTQTFDKLVSAHIDQLPSQAFSGIRQKLTEKYQTALEKELDNRKTTPTIIESMREACFEISQLPIGHEDFSAFRCGILRVYRRGRRAMRQVYTKPSSEGFHEWRKRVKYLRHQIEILDALWPKVLTQLADELHTLSDYLGDDHDLAVLRDRILDTSANFDTEKELLLLVHLIDKKRLELEALALPLGERLYFDTPKSFLRRLEVYWSAWETESGTRQRELTHDLQDRSPVYFRLDKDFLTTTMLAASLKISPQKVRKLINDQKLPAEKVGTIWVIRIDKAALSQNAQNRNRSYPGKLLSTQDVASHLFIDQVKVRKLIRTGKLSAIKMGPQWIVLEDDLTKFKKKTNYPGDIGDPKISVFKK